MPIIFRCIGKLRSMPARRRTRPFDAGRLGRPRGLPAAADPRAPADGAQGFGQAVRRRDHGAGARSRPRRTKLGQLWAYARDDGHGAAPTRRRSSMSMRPIARPSGRSAISPASRVCCRSTAMPVTGCSPSAVTYSLPSAGPCSPPLLRTRGRQPRRSPARRSNASQVSMPSRRTSVAAAPMSGEPCARTGAGRSSISSSPGYAPTTL